MITWYRIRPCKDLWESHILRHSIILWTGTEGPKRYFPEKKTSRSLSRYLRRPQRCGTSEYQPIAWCQIIIILFCRHRTGTFREACGTSTAVCAFYDVRPDDLKKTQKGDVQRASQCSGLSDAKDQERSFKGNWRAVWNRKIQFGEAAWSKGPNSGWKQIETSGNASMICIVRLLTVKSRLDPFSTWFSPLDPLSFDDICDRYKMVLSLDG